jgi:hypothetical protein
MEENLRMELGEVILLAQRFLIPIAIDRIVIPIAIDRIVNFHAEGRRRRGRRGLIPIAIDRIVNFRAEVGWIF